MSSRLPASTPASSGCVRDGASGTVAGVALVMLVAVLLAAAACIGNLLVCQTSARSTADLAAVSAADALVAGRADPCSVAARVLTANGARLGSCSIDGEDVSVEAILSTSVPLAPQIRRSSRAGPILCE